MQTIGLFFNQKKKQCSDLADKITVWLKKEGRKVREISTDEQSHKLPQMDFIICIGGDGSLIRLASVLQDVIIPVLGVNAGSLGFLTTVKKEEVFEELTCVLSGDYTTQDRFMLRAALKGKKAERFSILNDIVVSREGSTRFLDVVVKVGKSIVANFGGDGVIISTPTGSTAYSLSAGGPLLYPTLESVVITPVCPHSLKTRACVVPSDVTITVQVFCERDNEHACAIFDGHEKRAVASGSTVTINKATHVFKLIHTTHRNYFDIVNEKLQ